MGLRDGVRERAEEREEERREERRQDRQEHRMFMVSCCDSDENNENNCSIYFQMTMAQAAGVRSPDEVKTMIFRKEPDPAIQSQEPDVPPCTPAKCGGSSHEKWRVESGG